MNAPRAKAPPTSLSEWSVCLLLLMLPTIAAICTLGNISPNVQRLPFVIFATGILCAFPIFRARNLSLISVTIWVAFAALSIIALLRFAWAPIEPYTRGVPLTRAATLAAICAFLYLALARVGEDRARSNLKFLVFGPGVMAAISLSLFALGVQIGSVGVLASGARASHGEAEMLSALGVHVDRLALPLFESGNGGGAVGAIALAVGFMMIRRREPQLIRAAAGLSIVAGVAVTLISDSRGPLLAGVVAVILVWLLPRASKRLLTAIPLLIPFAPMIIIFVTTKLLSGQSAALSREGTDLATATGRSYVWSDVFEVVTRLDVDNLFGYGAFGQVRSGAGATYAYLFNVPQPQFTNAHNAVLQTALDSGWIGVVALIAVFVVSITSVATLASDRNQSVGRALLAGLVVFSMVAADEAIPTLNLLYLLAMFLAFTFAAFVAPTVRLYEPEHIELEESELELSSRLDPVLN